MATVAHFAVPQGAAKSSKQERGGRGGRGGEAGEGGGGRDGAHSALFKTITQQRRVGNENPTQEGWEITSRRKEEEEEEKEERGGRA